MFYRIINRITKYLRAYRIWYLIKQRDYFRNKYKEYIKKSGFDCTDDSWRVNRIASIALKSIIVNINHRLEDLGYYDDIVNKFE
jgi:hypothetical protein